MRIFFLTISILWVGNLYASNKEEKVFSIGVVPQFEAIKLQKIWTPILTKITKSTGLVFNLEMTKDIPSFETAFEQGQFDFVYLNPFHLLVANKEQGYLPLIRDTSRSLSGVLVVKANSGIQGPEDLTNKKIAFPSPNALGASILMRQELKDIFAISIQPIYVKTHDSVYLNVVLGQTAAGGGVGRTFNQQKNIIKDSLKIIHRTRSVPTHPIAYHPRIDDSVVNLFSEAIFEIYASKEGKELLKKIPLKEVGLTKMEDYQSLKDMGLDRFVK